MCWGLRTEKRLMGSAFAAEPREWFKGRHMVRFTMADHDWVMHKPSKRCPEEYPHLMTGCGEFSNKTREGKNGCQSI
jgi:hypothetical protein